MPARDAVCQKQKGEEKKATFRNSVTVKDHLIVVFARPVIDLP
jgi:hypothetical protein